jgi:hypothetical protein
MTGAGAFAQNDIHSCEADPATQYVYNQHRNSPDRVAVMREALIAHLDDIFLNNCLINSPGVRPGTFVAEYKTKFVAHADEPLFQYLYAQALTGADRPAPVRPLPRVSRIPRQHAEGVLKVVRHHRLLACQRTASFQVGWSGLRCYWY